MTRESAKDKLIEAAHSLMLTKGFPATTVDEICEAAGVSKGSFYHFFKSKEELGLAVLEAFYKRTMERLMEAEFTKVTDPLARVHAFFDHTEAVSEKLWGRGCLLGAFATDLAETNPRMRRRVSALFRVMTRGVAEVLDPAVKAMNANKAKAEKGPSATELAELFIAVIEGAVLLAKAHNDWRHVPKAIESFRHYIQVPSR